MILSVQADFQQKINSFPQALLLIDDISKNKPFNNHQIM